VEDIPAKTIAHAFVTDLDGTLVSVDTFVASLVALVWRRPWIVVLVPLWMVKGRAYCKARVAFEEPVSPERLPYNSEVLELIAGARKDRHAVVLATAAHAATAAAVAEHLGCFDAVLASTESVNLKGKSKRTAIQNWCDANAVRSFTYAGDSPADVHVWEVASKVVAVCPSLRLESKLKSLRKPMSILKQQRTGPWKQRVCSAIAETALACSPCAASATKETAARAAAFTVRTLQAMADHLRFRVVMAVFTFDLLTVPLTGSRFHRLSVDRRKRLWELTRNLPAPLARDFTKFFETLAVLGEHS
jgi:hypothetical protein